MRSALVLTSWYFPIKVVPWTTAITMLYKGVVDVIASYDEEVCSPSVTWKLPAVLRLRRVTPNKKTRIRYSRRSVYQRDGFRCQYCGDRLREADLTTDHVLPRCRGGTTTFTNIVTACKPCNLRKDRQSCDEAGMFPINWPRAPRELPMHSPTVKRMEPEWEPFLHGVVT